MKPIAMVGPSKVEVTIADLARLIRGMEAEQLASLAAELERPAPPRPRCPSREIGAGPGARQCVREEDHPLPHVAANGAEWNLGLRCRIGANEGAAVCARLDGHEGECVPRLPAAPPPVPAPAYTPQPRPARGMCARGMCPCGAPRKDHEGPTKTGGCARTNCGGYRKAVGS